MNDPGETRRFVRVAYVTPREVALIYLVTEGTGALGIPCL